MSIPVQDFLDRYNRALQLDEIADSNVFDNGFVLPDAPARFLAIEIDEWGDAVWTFNVATHAEAITALETSDTESVTIRIIYDLDNGVRHDIQEAPLHINALISVPIEENPASAQVVSRIETRREFSDREIATILHALRKVQDPANCNHVCDHFEEVEPLSGDEIDALCEAINLGGATLKLPIVQEHI